MYFEFNTDNNKKEPILIIEHQ